MKKKWRCRKKHTNVLIQLNQPDIEKQKQTTIRTTRFLCLHYKIFHRSFANFETNPGNVEFKLSLPCDGK